MDPSVHKPEEKQDVPPILVVDDELGFREGIRRILTARGYPVQTAASGTEALQLATEGEFPIVLVDLKMPGMDGFELIGRLRELHPATLCVVVSAFATIESAVQTTKMGAFDFVVKPFVPDDLLVVVRRAAETWRLGQEAERLRAEREAHLLQLAAEKTRLRTILQSMGDGLLVVNIDGDVVLDNPVARRLLGHVQRATLAGPLSGCLNDEKVLGDVARMLHGTSEEVAVSVEMRVGEGREGLGINPTPESVYLRVTLAPVRDEKGATLGVVVLLADITSAKAFERMKTLFVSMVAHELKAPIGAVEGYLNLILEGRFDSDRDLLRKTVARCLERTGALISLIQDLLEITRRENMQRERRIEPVDMKALAAGLVEFHRNDMERQKLSAQLVVDGGVRAVLGDHADLERVVTNLLSNAIKYNRPGGEIRVHVSMQGAVLCLEVKDTGIGMTPEETERLGEEFFRAKNPKTRMITGTGLGVALVKKIVDSYNGALQVESVLDQGSTFRVLLPAEPDAR
jgi:two-component system, OmpR family, phosphate regulon sensor histidine kinase PhoR